MITVVKGYFGLEKNNKSFFGQTLKTGKKVGSPTITKILTSAAIDAMPDKNLEQAILQDIFEKLDNKSSYDEQHAFIKSLSPGRRAIFSTRILEEEVDNGGFSRYFDNFNSVDDYASDAANGYLFFGLRKLAALINEAVETVRKTVEPTSEFGNLLLSDSPGSYQNKRLNDLDCRFYDLFEAENVSEVRIKHIKSRIHEYID